jgi:uncharacterized membrane protein YfcA
MKNQRKLSLLVLGLVTGFFSGTLGSGGGVLVVPVLILLFGYEIKKAVGTSLATMIPTVFVGIIAHYLINSGNIKLLIALFVITGSVIGARFGAKLVKKINSKTLTKMFAVVLLFIGLKFTGIINIPTGTVSDLASYPLLMVLGLITGLASALFGIGGGVILVPILNLFFGLSVHEAIATSLTIILPTTIAGSAFHRKFNNMDYNAIKFLVPTSLIGAVFGAITSNILPSDALKIIFGIFMILFSINLLRK